MEQELKMSAADQNRVKKFKELITNSGDAAAIHNCLLEIYFDYTQLLVSNPVRCDDNVSYHLYQLNEMINVLA